MELKKTSQRLIQMIKLNLDGKLLLLIRNITLADKNEKNKIGEKSYKNIYYGRDY